jgi:hypothetical protein
MFIKKAGDLKTIVKYNYNSIKYNVQEVKKFKTFDNT